MKHSVVARFAAPRMSRAQWLSLGATFSLAACTAPASPTRPGELAGSPEADATSEASAAEGAAPVEATSVLARADSGDAENDAYLSDGADEDTSRVDAPASDGGSAEGGTSSKDTSSSADVTADRGVDGMTDADALEADGGPRFRCGSTTCETASQWCYGYHGIVFSCQSLEIGCALLPSDPADAACPWHQLDASACPQSAACACVAIAQGCSCLDEDGGGVIVSCGTCYGSPPGRPELGRRSVRERGPIA
jgi:hypothetical protein